MLERDLFDAVIEVHGLDEVVVIEGVVLVIAQGVDVLGDFFFAIGQSAGSGLGEGAVFACQGDHQLRCSGVIAHECLSRG